MFRANTNADKASHRAPEEWILRQPEKKPGRLDWARIAEDSGKKAVGEDLEGLVDAGGELATVLDPGKCEFGDNAG